MKINKKGLSAVVATLMLILLALVLVGILWGVVTNLLDEQLNSTENCLNIYEKIEINDEYTCYNGTSKEFFFSINIADIKVDELLFGISADGRTTSFKITNRPIPLPNLRPYNGTYSGNIALPGENSGFTYAYNMTSAGFVGKPDKLVVKPVIGGTQCDDSDTTNDIYYC